MRDDVVDAVYIRVGHSELSIEWHALGRGPSPRLEAFDDAWRALADCPELFAWLATQHGKGPDQAEVIAGLLELGFADTTDRVGPALLQAKASS